MIAWVSPEGRSLFSNERTSTEACNLPSFREPEARIISSHEGLFFGDLIALWQYHSAHHNRRHCPGARKPKHQHQTDTGKTGIPAARKGQRQDRRPAVSVIISLGFSPVWCSRRPSSTKIESPHCPWYNDAMKTGILIGHKVVLGDPSVMAKVLTVGSGIDCSDRRNKAHSVCRHHFTAAPDTGQCQCCLKINQSGIRTGDSFSPQVVCFYPVQPVSGQSWNIWPYQGFQADSARLSPLCHGHINMLGHYSFTLAERVTRGHLRPLKATSEEEKIA